MLRPSVVILTVALCWTAASCVGGRRLSQPTGFNYPYAGVNTEDNSPIESPPPAPIKTPCVGTQCCDPTDCVCLGDCVEYPLGFGNVITTAAAAQTAQTAQVATTSSSTSNASSEVPECTGLVKETCCLASQYCPWNWWAPPSTAPPKQCVVENVSWTLLKYPSLFWKNGAGSVCQCPETKTPCAACTSCTMSKKG